MHYYTMMTFRKGSAQPLNHIPMINQFTRDEDALRHFKAGVYYNTRIFDYRLYRVEDDCRLTLASVQLERPNLTSGKTDGDG